MKKVSALVSKEFVLGLDTGSDKRLLLEQGFTKEFLDSKTERLVTFDGTTGRPVFQEAFAGKRKEIMINRPIIGMGLLETPDKAVIITALYCQNRTYYVVIKGPIVFVFNLDVTSLNMKDAVRELLNSNMVKGPRIFEHTAAIMSDFWIKALSAVYKAPEIIEITLVTRDGLPVPSRIYFSPQKPKDTILSIGGWCYGFDLCEFPKQQIAVGTKQFAADETKRTPTKEGDGFVRGNRIVIKKTNDFKVREPAMA